ncbi:MAG: exodeoxyribonuclease III [Candidatus Lloydbacteria bacterium RIFCSPHIGHO2_02_FULL_54_17]|uniref:Exodeoxyribonuclease III n=1 Tax=Candidatus Lloydbacteria bacterium RIFCSPHIGHO2_02_FULL_54_17 TaxID=1798664 RepID=A0A1G2DF46_9BACT|nr:MAG: exodeoxyribonuclease III [Candidatus Lloydbacteria bacterium RIFCSPHIGHO2_01_FULL_54_11]OGZ12265.1 MAG: exodeoxyribonuclease III [Candidatus Lloydbacteria bacterium RIFCSPHIGHO2_02_FULL_54_17]OGZ13968.1 MAG: exodeoxyribonuclease III [Candidatus Lloydbacteria bacterium RIFCSPLOWO2_01_FULL_54_18]OGZ16427.1 MAG: exodeoxyribonuclease III [Candidatus Lloydbacteria bacterium RIFCSPLOWO2_02_FULL_54_12]
MKLVSWNVNGLRAAAKKGFVDWLSETAPDVVGLQETKAEPEQLPEEVRNPKGYFAYFAHSKGRKGYSGVALYSKVEPKKVEYGIGIKRFDDEGRIVIGHYEKFVLLNVYFPNGGGGPERLKYKLDFYDAFLKYVEGLRKKGKKVVFCGDVNTAHEATDLARPKENEKNTGFLPEERAWIDELIYHGYVDTYRNFHPHKEGAYSYWDIKSAARDRNVGWRLDYFFIAPELFGKLKSAGISSGVYGSDHCPVWVEIAT